VNVTFNKGVVNGKKFTATRKLIAK